MKKYIKFIVIIIIVISSLATISVLVGKQMKPRTYQVYEQINDMMDKKESFLVYFRNDDPYKCNSCVAIDKMVDFYKSVFGLNFIIFDTDHTKELAQINLDLGLQPNYIENPSIMIFKDGKWKATSNAISEESFLKEQLVSNGFIDEKSANIETEIIDDEVFEELFKEDNKHLIVVKSSKSGEMRKMLYNIAMNDSYFQYYSIVKGGFVNYSSFFKLSDLTHDKMNDTTLVVVKNSEVIDKINFTNQTEIKEFLKKNEIIKE